MGALLFNESVSHPQDTHYQHQKIVTVLQTPSGGGQDDKSGVGNAGFVSSQTTKERPNKPDPQTKITRSQVREQDSPNTKIRYATPGGDDPGGLNTNSGNDFQDIPNAEDTISDPEFWNTILGEETEDESMPVPATSPTKKLTQQSLKENDSVTKIIHPREFNDWEGKKRVVKSKELKNATFSHGFEAGTSGPEDLVECPIQLDPNKYQRKNCSRVTDETVQNLWDKIVDITTAKSTKIGKIKFKTKMPYFDSETAIAYMNIITGDCFFYHENGVFWGYKKYSEKQIPSLLADVSSSLKWASDTSSPKSDL